MSRGQGMSLTTEQVAVARAKARVAAELRGRATVEIVWSPEETEALRQTLDGKGVAAR